MSDDPLDELDFELKESDQDAAVLVDAAAMLVRFHQALLDGGIPSETAADATLKACAYLLADDDE